MIKTLTIKFTLALILLAGIGSLQAQTVKELEAQRKKTLSELESTNKILSETKKSQRSSLNKLTVINKNIQQRKTLITTIGKEIRALDAEMSKLGREKKELEAKLEKLKKDYAKMVQEAHINKSAYSKIMFVLSANSFDQSYRRLRYLQEYSDYRKDQVKRIEKIKIDIIKRTEELDEHKLTKTLVVKQQEEEAKKLSKDKKTEDVLLTDLQKKEKTLRANLKKQQKKAADLDNQIAKIIAEEIRKAEAIAEAKRKAALKKSGKSTDTATKTETETKTAESSGNAALSVLTKEEALISGNFSTNIGRLPWPTDKGFISGRYGVHPHPVLKHVQTNNKGVYIQTPAGTSARAVFEGEVTQCFAIPGSNNAVIIKHGEYRTVYANLTTLNVKVGDKVKGKQTIGKIYTDSENENKTEVYFQVYKNKTLLNPEQCMAR